MEESDNFSALGDSTYQPTIYIDAFGNEVFETYSDVVVAAAAPAGPVVSSYSGFSLSEDVDIGGTLCYIYISTSLTPSIPFSTGGDGDVDYPLVGAGGSGGQAGFRAGAIGTGQNIPPQEGVNGTDGRGGGGYNGYGGDGVLIIRIAV